MVREISRDHARRIAVRAQLLDANRPTDLLDVVRRLGFLQVDLTDVVAPHAELALWSRIGSSHPRHGVEAARGDGSLVEFRAMLRPVEDIALFRGDMAIWPGPPPRPARQQERVDWVVTNDQCRREILALLRADGPLPARAIPDTCEVPWRSSGWTNNRNVMKLLEAMEACGEVAVASREGRERQWDLAERVHGDGTAVPPHEAHLELAARRLRALGIARPRALAGAPEPYDVSQVGERVRVAGTRSLWRADPDLLAEVEAIGWSGRTALLSPLDRLVFDRGRLADIFEFDYQLEMYKPAATRRWGYWAMPILHDDRLIGKLDTTADRDAGALMVDAVHEDGNWTPSTRRAVADEIERLAEWLGLRTVAGTTPR